MQTQAQAQPAKPAAKKKQYVVYDYASMRNLKADQTKNEPSHDNFLPGLGFKTKKASLFNKKAKKTQQLIQEPQLLSSAIAHMQQKLQESQSQTSSNYLAVNSLINSREPTPTNPLNSSFKRRSVPSYNKNKVNSIASELYDIQSNPQSEKAIPKYKHPDFKLYDRVLGQSQAVYKHVFGQVRSVDPLTVVSWKDCLSHQDKSQIFVPVGEEKVEVPFTTSRVYPLNQIQKEFKRIYGSGKNRSLTIGEEAIILQAIQRYLKMCSVNPIKIGRKDFDILQDVLTDCKMSELQNYPLCMKQIEAHFKIMATRWRYSGELNLKDKMVESGLAMGKNNFLDLSKETALTAFVMQDSNADQLP